MKSYTTLRNQFGALTANTSATNLLLGDQLINDSLRYLTTKYFFNEFVDATQVTVASQQNYQLPYNIKTLINVFINIGNIRYQLRESPTRQFWDSLNFVPYTSDIPQYYYIINRQIYFFPSPSSAGNTITYVYKRRIRDLSCADVALTGVGATNGLNTISGTGFVPDMTDRWIRITADPTSGTNPTGDEEWYQISNGDSSSGIIMLLYNMYQGATITGANAVVGEMPLLGEDYHDLPVYRACSIYFTTRVPDPNRAELFMNLYNEGLAKLDAEFGSKSWSVAITANDVEVQNPNLFVRNMSG